jgi:hypothetical protein
LSVKNEKIRLLAVLVLIPIILSSLGAVLNVGATYNQLMVSLGPSNLIADGADHNCVFVQLVNNKGEPIQAPENVTITVTSSRLDVGTVEGTINIPEGSSFGRSTFYATKNPGTTLIAATAPGYMTGGAELTTVSSAVSPHLKIYPLPSVAPAINGTKGSVVIEILNERGIPYPSTENVTIKLATNSSVLTLPSTAMIQAGSYYTTISYNVRGNFTVVNGTSVTPYGNVTLSALAQGFRPDSAVIQVMKPGNETRRLFLEIGPSNILPKDSLRDSVVVSLLDKNGAPVVLNGTVAISLSSSADKTVAMVDKSVTIANNTYYTYANMTSIGIGNSLIAVSAQGLVIDTATITVDGSIPTRLDLYINPDGIILGNPLTPIVTIQTVDQRGAPVIVDEDINVFLSSSNTAIGTLAQFVIIPKGHYYTQVKVEPESKAGTISIASSARGFEPSSGALTTIELVMNATLTTTRPTKVNDTVTATILVNRLGAPIKGASVTWSVIGGVVNTQETATNGDGLVTATFTQTSSTMRISVLVTKPGYKDLPLTRLSTIPTQQSTELTVNIIGLVVPLFNVIVGVGVLVIAVFGLYIFLKYRKKSSDRLEVVG